MAPFLQEGDHNAIAKKSEKSRVSEIFIYRSKSMNKVVQQAVKSAVVKDSICIIGHRGTGKKALALEIHRKSPVRFGPVFSLHCKSLSEKALNTELFGFKGDEITASSEGAMRKADGGTLILEDVSNLPQSVQNQLHQYIQTGYMMPVGSKNSVPVQTRLIFTIHKTKESQDILVQKFFERVNPISICVPDLSERKEDISDLVRYFLSIEVNGERSKKKIHITSTALDALKCYKWPGNIKELKNLCERFRVFCQNDKITINDLPRYILDTNECAVQIKYDPSLRLSDISRLYILSALKHFPSKKQAAQALGITVKTLYNRLHDYGIFDRYAIHSRD